MTADDLVRGVVRIWSGGEASEVVGTGVLVAPGLVLTCAHVAARAWGEAPEFEEGLGRTVRIDLPATAPHVWHEATVVHWLPRRPAAGGAYDLAGLRFAASARGAGVPLPLVDDEAPWGKQVRAFGFPAGRPDGSYASGVLRDVLANGWVLVKGGAEAREFSRPGYSGGPVTTDEGVVGLLTEGDSDVRVREALMVPVRAILGAWPELQDIVSRSPFPGLASFTGDDAPHFHGRERAIAEIAHAVASPPHLVVLAGPSGSGKSSLIAAGVLPALAASHGPDGRSWHTLVWAPGPAPFATLARGLLRAAHGAADDTRVAVDAARLAHDLEGGDVTLADVLGQDDDARWAIVVDQPEALLLEVGEASHPSRSQRLFDALMQALDDKRLEGRIAVLVAVRTDFLDELLRHPALARHVRDDLVRYLGPVDDLREVIEGPLRDSGLARLEPGLTDRLLMAVADVPNPLPLLQFTLAELWRKRRAGRLTHEAYDELGGVRQAVANEAERLVGAFPPEDLATVRDVLLQLGRPGSGDLVARRAARFEELGDRGRHIVTKLADARLVTTDRDAEGIERVEVVHESLFEHWPRLRAWWREAADFRRWQEGLRFAVRVWTDEGQHPSDLLQGPRLRAAEAHLRDRPDAFGPEELSFVLRSGAHEQETDEASRSQMQQELRLRHRMNWLLGVGMAAALVLALTTVWQTSAVRRSQAEVQSLLQATTAANVALGQLTEELELSLGTSRSILARQLGIQAVAIANDPGTFGSGMRLAALLAAYAARLDPGPASYDHLLRTLLAQPTYRATLADDATAVALDPTGRLLAVGDARGGVRLVDVVDGASVGGRIEGHVGSVTSLAFGVNGDALVSGGADGRLVAWSTAPFRREAAFPSQHAGPIAALAITFDGRILLSTDLTGTLRSWDAANHAPLATFARHAPASADLVAAATAGIPVLASAVDGQDQDAAVGHRAWGAAIATHPARSLVVVAVQGGVVVLDAEKLENVWSPADGAGDTAGVAFTADGAALVSVSETGTVRRWTLDTGGAPARWASGVAGVRSLAPGPAADRVLIGTAHGAAVWFDLTIGRPFATPFRGHGTDVTGLAVGDELVVTASSDGRVVTWDRTPRHGLGVSLGTAGWAPHGLAIDDAGEHAYVGSQDGTLTRLSLTDPAAGAIVIDAHQGGVYGTAFAQGRLATIGRDGRLVIRDPATLEPLSTPFVHDDLLWSITIDPDERSWTVGGVRGIVARVPWNDAGPNVVLRGPTRRWAPGAVVARTDGDTWAVALEHEIELWRDDTVVGRVEQVRRVPVSTLAFDPSGTRLLASSGSLVTLFSVPSLEVVASWPEAQFGVYARDGSLLALGGADGGVRLVDGRTLTAIGLPFRGHAASPTRLAFTPDGRWLVTADVVGDVRLWPTHAEAWLDRACELAWQDLGADEITAILGEHEFESPCVADRG